VLELSKLRGDIDRKADPILVPPSLALHSCACHPEKLPLARIYPVNGVIISLHIPDLLR